MDRAKSLIGGQRSDDAFDVPPVTKMRDVSVISGCSRPRSGLDGRVIAIALNEVRSVRQGYAAVNERNVHSFTIDDVPFPDCRRASSTRR